MSDRDAFFSRTPSKTEGQLEKKARLALVSVQGNATEAETKAALEALEELVDEERRTKAASIWRRAGRAQGRRLGMYDYRDRFEAADAWRLSARFPVGGREYPGRLGRGDTR